MPVTSMAVSADHFYRSSRLCDLFLWLHFKLRYGNRKFSAFFRFADQTDLASEQFGQLPADGQSQPCSSVFTTGRSIRLLEGFEDQLMLILRYTDTGIPDGEVDKV